MNGTIGMIALLGMAFFLFAVLSADTSALRWRMVRLYWLCAVVATGTLFSPTAIGLALGWAVSSVIVFALLWVAAWLERSRDVQLPHHNHSPH